MWYNFFMNKSKKRNYIYIHKINGKIQRVKYIWGLWITFKGNNSVVNIYEPCIFKFQVGANRSHIKIKGDNNVINIRSNTANHIKSLRIKAVGSNNIIDIGKNIVMSDGVDIDFANTCNLKLNIGDNCLFGQNIKFMLGDHHNIYCSKNLKKINSPQNGIEIGNNVWLARNVTILKDSKISSYSVVGYGSIVTKKFEKENVLIAGIPAKVVKEGISWDY